jgi:hypothetical protein
MGVAGVLALVALLPSFGLVAFDDLVAVTMGTQHGNEYHGALLLKPSVVWHICGQSANLQHDHQLIDLSQPAQERSRNIIRKPKICDHAVFLLDFTHIIVYLAAIAQGIMTMTVVTTLLEAAMHR